MIVSHRKYRPLILLTVFLTAVLSSCAGSGHHGKSSHRPKPPHILIILTDDLGWNDVGYHGSPIRTPTIDSLAHAGVRLEHFYALPVCTPTRHSLLTGKFPIRNGFQIGVIKPWAGWGLPEEEVTLPEFLKQSGYYTAIIGKWHLGHQRTQHLPMNHGFDYQYGPYNGLIDYYSHRRFGAPDWHRNQQSISQEGHATDLFAQEAVHLIDHHDTSQPLFLYLPFTAPHTPLQALPQYEAMYGRIFDKRRRKFSAMTTQLDDAVANVVDALKKKDMFSETLILFLSDNGAANVDGGGSNFPLRGGKGTLYEGGLRVPAFMLWPDQIAAGGVVSSPTHMVDLYPTLAGLTGRPAKQLPRSLDGIDIWDLVSGQAPGAEREILLSLDPKRGAILSGSWKLIARYSKLKPPRAELFDLAVDPEETLDVSSSHPEITAKLLSRLDEYAAQAAPPKHRPKPKGWQPPAEW